IIDKIWNFFSSVKVGIWIIILLLVAPAIGTIFPQEMYIPPLSDPTVYYKEQYGVLGQLYYDLGFHNLYGSWWYMLLIAALGLSLIVASLDRFVPLYRSLKKQRV
ncbi:cytochrome c biogenesis protein ResB, partial [Staphylococcus sp. SIMBA_130]